MTYRTVISYVVLISLGIFLESCQESPTLSSITVTPATATVAMGTPVQFTATGAYTHGGHPVQNRDITDLVTWASTSPGIATINSAGLATGVGSGTVSVTATLSSSYGPVSGTASLSVTGTGGAAHDLISIAIIPSTQALNAIGEAAQFTAIGTFDSSPTTENLAGMVTWQSSDTDVASVSSSGQATAVGCASSSCTATITASGIAQDGSTITGTATLTVSPGSPPAPRALSAITIIPGSGTQFLYALGETAQFIAIGTYSASPTTVDITDQVTWQSSDTDLATITSSGGLATAVACSLPEPCLTNITAESATGQGGSTIVGTSNVSVYPHGGGSNLPSLAVYEVGAGTGTVVSSPVGVSCTLGAGCTGYFTSGSSVQLTATPAAGSSFGGWSANCTPTLALTCTVVMDGNQTVGAIFNN